MKNILLPLPEDIITIRPKLKGGSTRILFHNTAGFTSNRHNQHKLEFYNRELEKVDIAVLQETGCNKNTKMWTAHDDFMIARENKMEEVENE